MYLKEEIIKEKLSKELYLEYVNCIKNYLPFNDKLIKKYIEIINEFALQNRCKEFAFVFNTIDGKQLYKYQTIYKNNNLIYLCMEDLINSEIDASSIENGGLKDILRAKGLLTIDTNLSPYIRDKVLYIPATCKGIHNDYLDYKKAIINSIQELNKIAIKVYNLLGEDYSNISPYLGVEQEFYIIKKEDYLKRRDLMKTGHVLLASMQKQDNNYLFKLTEKEHKIIEKIAKELKEVNIIPKSIHKEVGISQYEIAPAFSMQYNAIHNDYLTREIIESTCEKQGYTAIFDDKPFIGLSGSGKHNNYSLMADENDNLLSPTSKHFLLTISAFVLALDKYGELLISCGNSHSNERRLGEKEAPPAACYIFLGDEIEKCLKNPTIYFKEKINSERNRTAPISFVENRLEFRTLGSSVNIEMFNLCLNTILIESFKEIETYLINGLTENDVINTIYKKHKKVIGNTNFYLNKKNINFNYYDSLQYLYKHKSIFIDNKIMNNQEIQARINICSNKYLKDKLLDYRTVYEMIRKDILPSLNNELKEVSLINEAYLNEYDMDKIEFIKQISIKFHEYCNKITQLLNQIDDEKNENLKIERLMKSKLLTEINECFTKIESQAFDLNLTFVTQEKLLFNIKKQ